MEIGTSEKPCHACVSLDDLLARGRSLVQKRATKQERSDNDDNSVNDQLIMHDRRNCPVDKDELGRSTWKLLHTVSVYYPEKPSEDHKRTASTFLHELGKLYPCDFCAKDLRNDLKDDPPKLDNREEFAQWMCRLHNKVNVKTGKPEFDCSKVFERWRDGWKDGSCNY